jgi:hypothetical protein
VVIDAGTGSDVATSVTAELVTVLPAPDTTTRYCVPLISDVTGGVVADATGPNLLMPAVSLSDQGKRLRVVVSNTLGRPTSPPAVPCCPGRGRHHHRRRLHSRRRHHHHR